MRTVPAWVMEHWPDAIVVTDSSGRIEYVNAAFEKLTGYRRRDALGRTPSMLHSGRHDRAFYNRMWRQLRKGRTYRAVFINRRKDGRLFHEEQTIRGLRGRDGRIACFVSAGRDVSARVQQIERLQHSATHDPLTDLPNRALFADRLAQALRQAQRRGERVAVVMLDLDAFKSINTRFGHLAGDAVLRAVARRTLRCLRKIDTVARIGGDEFALVLPAMRSRQACARVLENVRAANARALRHAGRMVPVSVSLGASLYPRDGRSERTLRRRADRALYQAKESGGNCVRFA